MRELVLQWSAARRLRCLQHKNSDILLPACVRNKRVFALYGRRINAKPKHRPYHLYGECFEINFLLKEKKKIRISIYTSILKSKFTNHTNYIWKGCDAAAAHLSPPIRCSSFATSPHDNDKCVWVLCARILKARVRGLNLLWKTSTRISNSIASRYIYQQTYHRPMVRLVQSGDGGGGVGLVISHVGYTRSHLFAQPTRGRRTSHAKLILANVRPHRKQWICIMESGAIYCFGAPALNHK